MLLGSTLTERPPLIELRSGVGAVNSKGMTAGGRLSSFIVIDGLCFDKFLLAFIVVLLLVGEVCLAVVGDLDDRFPLLSRGDLGD